MYFLNLPRKTLGYFRYLLLTSFICEAFEYHHLHEKVSLKKLANQHTLGRGTLQNNFSKSVRIKQSDQYLRSQKTADYHDDISMTFNSNEFNFSV